MKESHMHSPSSDESAKVQFINAYEEVRVASHTTQPTSRKERKQRTTQSPNNHNNDLNGSSQLDHPSFQQMNQQSARQYLETNCWETTQNNADNPSRQGCYFDRLPLHLSSPDVNYIEEVGILTMRRVQYVDEDQWNRIYSQRKASKRINKNHHQNNYQDLLCTQTKKMGTTADDIHQGDSIHERVLQVWRRTNPFRSQQKIKSRKRRRNERGQFVKRTSEKHEEISIE